MTLEVTGTRRTNTVNLIDGLVWTEAPDAMSAYMLEPHTVHMFSKEIQGKLYDYSVMTEKCWRELPSKIKEKIISDMLTAFDKAEKEIK